MLSLFSFHRANDRDSLAETALASGDKLLLLRCSPHYVWRLTILPLALMLFLATAMMSPLAYHEMPDSLGHDLANHVGGIVEAANALREGQFPIRVAPQQNDQTRYPLFQYYGQLPYLAGGLLCLHVHVDPFTAFKLVLLCGLTLGGFYTYRCARLLTRQTLASLVAGATFLMAPYMLVDIHSRFAYSETVSFCLLPAVLFYSLCCFQGRRWSAVFCAAAAWSGLGMSHNITYLYGSLFFGLLFCSFVSRNRKFLRGILRVGAAYALGLALNAWFVAPQQATLPLLGIAELSWSVYDCQWLTPLGVLLAPGRVLPAPHPQPLPRADFGLQCGWPILGAIALACYYAFNGIPLCRRQRGWLIRLLLMTALAVVLVWSPVDFWQYLPRMFSYVQFSYRLLMFVTLGGSLLAGCVLAHMYRGGLRPQGFLVCLLVLGMTASSYLPVQPSSDQVSVAAEMRHPNVGRAGANDAYRLTPRAPVNTMAPLLQAAQPPQLVPASQTRPLTQFGRTTVCALQASGPALVQLPVLYYPGLLQVRDHGHDVEYGSLEGLVAIAVGPGDHRFDVRFMGCRWANYMSATAWLLVLAGWCVTLPLPLAAATGRALCSRGWLPHCPPLVHTGAVATASIALLVGFAALLRLTWLAPPLVKGIEASTTWSPIHDANQVFDGVERTAWAASSGNSQWLRIDLSRPVALHSLELLGRGTHLYETFHDVRVRLYHKGALVLDQPNALNNAAIERLQIVSFSPTQTDKVELLLDRPVTKTPWGKDVDPAQLHPGYAEIKLGYR